MTRTAVLAIALALFAAGCGTSRTAGTGQHDDGAHIGGPDPGAAVDTPVYVTACTQVDQALQYRDTGHRAPMLAAVRKLNEHPKSTAESFFLGAATVVIEAEGVPGADYSPRNKTEVIKGCKEAGHPLKRLT